MLDVQRILAARERIQGGIIETACFRSPRLETRIPGKHHLKAEFRQRTGSFKDRGALNKLLLLGDDARKTGVIAASAGNHAQALAFHASRLGIPVTIVMPETAPLVKVANTRGHGATVFQVGQTISDGMAEVECMREAEGFTLIHAFDDEEVAAGQGTMGLEILEQVPDVTTILVPVGGGGMISGVVTAVKAARPSVRVIGIEAQAAPSTYESLKAGRPVHVSSTETLADGIAVKEVGETTFPVIEALVDDIVLVNEDEIAAGIFYLLEQEKVVVEGGGAVGVAALLAEKLVPRAGGHTVSVLSGGNIDVNIISRVIDRGLWLDGRITRLRITVRDRPGYLSRLTKIVAGAGANILDIRHTRVFADISVADVEITILAETRGRDHVVEIMELLKGQGHDVEEGPQ